MRIFALVLYSTLIAFAGPGGHAGRGHRGSGSKQLGGMSRAIQTRLGSVSTPTTDLLQTKHRTTTGQPLETRTPKPAIPAQSLSSISLQPQWVAVGAIGTGAIGDGRSLVLTINS